MSSPGASDLITPTAAAPLSKVLSRLTAVVLEIADVRKRIEVVLTTQRLSFGSTQPRQNVTSGGATYVELQPAHSA